MLIEIWTQRRIGSAESYNICQNRQKQNEMLIIKSEHIGTYTMAKLTEALRRREQHVRATPTITSDKTRRCLMIVLLFKTHTPMAPTFTQTPSTRVIHTVNSILHAVSPLAEQFRAATAKRFIKTSKRMEHIVSPQLQFGKISMGMWNWISCVICIHVLSLAIPLNL